MKITRLRIGYAVRLSDSEWDLIASLVADGECRTIFENENGTGLRDAGYSPAVQAAYTRRTKGGDFLRIDEDRRHG